MKYLISGLLLTVSFFTIAQSRWQQRVEYKMDVTLDDINHQVSGRQVLTYYNNSPDVLTSVFYHLYFNAFQPGSAMDIRSRSIEDPDPRVSDRIADLTAGEQGFLHVNSLKMDGRKQLFTENETILEVILDKPIQPGAKAVFEMEFLGQVPLQIRRCGRNNAEGIDYSMSQWYPKLCEYDGRGWHPDPYIGREFYGVWGDFDVNITLDKKYTVAATGLLQNAAEIGKGYIENGKAKTRTGKNLTWKFKAANVHDFVWAADPDYVHDIKKVPDGPELHFFYQNDPVYGDTWKKMQDMIVKNFVFMSKNFGQYPYPVYSVIQGGDGGMEYPMATLITGNRKLPSLVGVTVHEAAHSWYQGVLATNESLYPWMDEGFTSYASTEAMQELFVNGVKGDHSDAYKGYYALVKEGKLEALDTHADHFSTNNAYGVAAYNIGEMYLEQLSYIIGQENLNAGLLKYFDTWKFKHPTDEDFLHQIELQCGMVLDWYNEYFVHTTKTIDYSIVSMEGNGTVTSVGLFRKGLFPMPIECEVSYKNGTREMFYMPLDLMRGEKKIKEYDGKWNLLPDWKWVDRYYTIEISQTVDKIESIVIDPSGKMADIDRTNNSLMPAEGVTFILENR